MKRFFKLDARKQVNMTTEFARSRMVRSMPGETAALASLHLGRMSF
jgi:hypothetical protein